MAGFQASAPSPTVTVRNEALRPRQRRIALVTILGPALGLLVAIGVGLERGFTRLDLGMLLVGYFIGQCTLDLGFHRLLAHRSFETHRWVRALLAIGGSMAGQGRLVHWVANHRRHHIHSDTLRDPHSPYVRARRADSDQPEGEQDGEPLGLVRGLLHAQWGHMLTDDVPNCTLFARDLGQDPLLRRLNEHYALIVWSGLALPALIGWALAGPWGALSGLLWGGLVRMFCVQNVTWAVASASHRFGSRRFDTGDQSRNLLWTALLSFGSGYQNNHHAFPNAAIYGMRWWEFDVSGVVLHLMRRLGLAWNLQRPSPMELAAKELRAVRVP